MIKIDLEYLQKRSGLLTEMARGIAPRAETNPSVIKFKTDIVPEIKNALFNGWKPPASTTKVLAEYIGEMLYRHLNGIEFHEKSFGSYALMLKKTSNETLRDYHDWINGGSDDSNKAIGWALSYMMNQDPKSLTSKEFVSELVNPEIINQWRDDYNTVRKTSSNRNSGYTKDIKQKYGTSADKFAKLKGDVWPIIIKINRKAKALIPKDILNSLRNKEKVVSSQDNVSSSNDEMYPLETFVETLIGIIDDDISLNDYNINKNELIKTLKMLEQRVAEQRPVTKDTIYAKIISVFPDEEFVSYISEEFEDSLEIGKTEGAVEQVKDVTETIKSVLDIYSPGFLDNIVDKEIITNDERNIVMKWKELLNFAEGNNDEQDVDAMTSKQEHEFTRGMRGYETNKRKDKKDLPLKKLEAQYKELSMSEDPDLDELDRLRDQISQIKKGTVNEDVGIMGYMSEQVQKDSLFNKVGEFKERGFKKPLNYFHWMMIND